MGVKQLTNPNNAFGETSDSSNYYQETIELKNTGGAAIVAGDLVSLKYTATGTLFECEQAKSNGSGQSAATTAVVALDSIAVNATGRLVVFGYARVNVGAGTPAKDNSVINTTTAGLAGVSTPDATTVAGTLQGKYLGVKDANNFAPCWVAPS